MKIVVKEFNNHSIIDVYLNDDDKIIDFEQGLDFTKAVSKIEEFAKKYNLPSDTLIVDNVFNDNEQLVEQLTANLSKFL